MSLETPIGSARTRVPLFLILVLIAGCAPGSDGGEPVEAAAAADPEAAAEAGPWELEWARGRVFYEIFVRSFADSDGDGVGDLAGLTARLDYLNDGDPATRHDLGVEGLWLMPVFESPSYHGYDTVDYDVIDAEYGSLEELQRFLAEAHRRGIRVIADLMINHTGVDHPWFREAASSPESPRRDWYVWRRDDPGWTQPWSRSRTWHPHDGWYYYGLFWRGMPDLDFRNPEVQAEVLRIADLWLDRGLDGYRLDAARHLVAEGPGEGQNDTAATHAFWRRFSAHVRARRPDALLVGEIWSTPSVIAPYYGDTSRLPGGDELPMTFDFPLAEAILAAVKEGDAAPVASKLAEIQAVYPPGVLDAPFLTNHDMIRLAAQLDGHPGRLRSAAAVLLSLPGTPFLYYGEEVGLTNGPGSDDPQKRTPMPWTDAEPGGGFTTGEPWLPFAPGRETANVAAQSGDADSLLAHYRRWIHARNGSPALRRGEIAVSTPEGPVLAFLRRSGEEELLVAHNLGPETTTAGPYAPGAESLEPVADLPAPAAPEKTPDGWRLTLPPWTSAAWRLR